MKTGRQADADYKRPQPNQHPSSPSASSAGFTGWQPSLEGTTVGITVLAGCEPAFRKASCVLHAASVLCAALQLVAGVEASLRTCVAVRQP